MLFGSLNLRRKFIATIDPTSNNDLDEYSNARKRMRIEDPTSVHEANIHHSQGACAAGHQRPETRSREEEEKEVEAKLEELKATYAQVKKEAELSRGQVKKLREQDLRCMICQKVIQNPQTLKCGHSACFTCLRKLWTSPPAEDDNAPMIDTDAESDLEEESSGMDAPNLVEPIPALRPRRRHRFSSAVDRVKYCPYCNKEVQFRPVPYSPVCEMLQTMNQQHSSLSDTPLVPARKDSGRKDI